MSRCLEERTLILLHYGEGTEADRGHLTTCLRCAARAQRLARELDTIGTALGQPRSATPTFASRRRRRRMVVAAGLAAALAVLAVTEAWFWRTSRTITAQVADVETLAFLDQVDAALTGSDPGAAAGTIGWPDAGTVPGVTGTTD
jgi:hypothetical protein